ncbi:acetate--CoA ligase [bacterium]|nr:MAG: acetate--CoA ligase [bacterium]
MTHGSTWDWQASARAAGAQPDGRFNCGAVSITHPRAIVWKRADGQVRTVSGGELQRLAGRLAGALRALGVRRGDRVAGLLSRRPETYAVALAVWRLGAIYVPLFSGFRGEGLRVRIADSEALVIVTDAANRENLGQMEGDLPPHTVAMIGGGGVETDHSLESLMQRVTQEPSLAETKIHDTATIMYTSGTSGRPKGCMIPHHGLITLSPYVTRCLAVSPDDLLFSGADAGWAYGLYTTGLAPLSMGCGRVLYEGPFDVEGWLNTARELGAGHLAAAPTAFRQIAAAGVDDRARAIKAATSAGEPLDAATFEWFQTQLGLSIHDSYGLTELGMVTANLRGPNSVALAAGSMGTCLPGFEIQLVDRGGAPVPTGEVGRIAVRDNGFLLGAGYWGRDSEWAARLQDGWWLTEDLARQDEAGRYWYGGRADDVIVSAGYNISPLEVEAALMKHPLVADAACVGEPDPVRGQAVTAYVVLREQAPADLDKVLRRWVGERVGRHAAPRRVEARTELPRTASGKLQRANLRTGGM